MTVLSGAGALLTLITALIALFKGTGSSAQAQAAYVAAAPVLFAVWTYAVHHLEATRVSAAAHVAGVKAQAAATAPPSAESLVGAAGPMLAGMLGLPTPPAADAETLARAAPMFAAGQNPAEVARALAGQ